MYQFKFFSFFTLLIALNACQLAPEAQTSVELYFDLRDLMEKQISRLDSLDPKVEKTVYKGDQKQSQAVQPEDWRKELKMFIEANINRAIYEGQYAVRDSMTSSGLYKIYEAKENDLKTRYLKVHWNQDQSRLRGGKVVVSKDNFLYASQKELQFTCQTTPSGASILESYKIQGYQKSVFGQNTEYQVETQIIY